MTSEIALAESTFRLACSCKLSDSERESTRYPEPWESLPSMLRYKHSYARIQPPTCAMAMTYSNASPAEYLRKNNVSLPHSPLSTIHFSNIFCKLIITGSATNKPGVRPLVRETLTKIRTPPLRNENI